MNLTFIRKPFSPCAEHQFRHIEGEYYLPIMWNCRSNNSFRCINLGPIKFWKCVWLRYKYFAWCLAYDCHTQEKFRTVEQFGEFLRQNPVHFVFVTFLLKMPEIEIDIRWMMKTRRFKLKNDRSERSEHEISSHNFFPLISGFESHKWVTDRTEIERLHV